MIFWVLGARIRGISRFKISGSKDCEVSEFEIFGYGFFFLEGFLGSLGFWVFWLGFFGDCFYGYVSMLCFLGFFDWEFEVYLYS